MARQWHYGWDKVFVAETVAHPELADGPCSRSWPPTAASTRQLASDGNGPGAPWAGRLIRNGGTSADPRTAR